MKRLAIYYRVSTLVQDFASQKLEVEKWLADLPPSKRPETIQVFQDKVSGKAENEAERVQYQALKDAIAFGEVDAVLVYNIDRLGRDAISIMEVLIDWIKRGVEFFSATQPIFQLGKDNPLRLSIITIFAELAQMEREKIVARTKAGQEAARAKGVRFGAPEKHGEATVFQIRDLQSRGYSQKRIAEALNLPKSTVSFLINKRPQLGAH